MGLWTHVIKNKIIHADGSVQNIPEILHELKAVYRTVWEIKQKTWLAMAVDRGCYIQTQSLNIHMDQPNFGKLTSLHFYAWSKEKSKVEDDETKMALMVCSLTNREECMGCGS
ncbi:hypothetical protein V6N13_076617 [Hibiscus sabdariffa]